MRRRYDKEIMDDISITDGRIRRALDELRIINIFLGGRNISRDGIVTLARGLPIAREPALTILDIGAGGSDSLDTLPGEIRRAATIVSLDINKGVCAYLIEHDNARFVICANAFTLPIRGNGVDIIHVSLFLHHFKEEEIDRLLRQFLETSRIGIVINDLHRSIFAFAGIWLLTHVFPASHMVRHDGPLSVQRGFLRSELEAILSRLPASSYSLRRRWAFRWLIVIKK
ncbi:MAG TPA: methyltransferase domain-containing protein [Bacteroidota bacterium]|nr:methyltransferase domain-containing protein [Bacteroidota bacterium]